MKTLLNETIDITNELSEYGITSKNFIPDGHFLEFMLLSSLRADGFSNLGYEFSDAFVLKLGACTVNIAFGYVEISDELRKFFKLNSRLIKLKETTFKFRQLSLLFNLLYNIDIKTLNISVYNINFFTDIVPSVSFTINRTPKYIRNLKESMEKVFLDDEVVKIKGKDIDINNDMLSVIELKKEHLKQLYSNSVVKDYYGNINITVGLGIETGMMIFKSNEDCINLETFLYVSDSRHEYKNLGYMRITVINLGYSDLLSIDGIEGGEENENLLLQMQEDMKAGLNLVLGVLDGWTSLRNNRKSIFMD